MQQKLAQMLSRLIKIAEEFNVAVYLTNQGNIPSILFFYFYFFPGIKSLPGLDNVINGGFIWITRSSNNQNTDQVNQMWVQLYPTQPEEFLLRTQRNQQEDMYLLMHQQ